MANAFLEICKENTKPCGLPRICDEELGVNFIKPNGELLSKDWYMYARFFHHGYAAVQLGENSWNYLKADGTFLNSELYREAWDFESGVALIALGENEEQTVWNFLKTDGTYLNEEWYSEVERLLGAPLWKVRRKDGKWNFATLTGEIICSKWYKDVRELVYSVLQVQLDDGSWHTIDENGEIID